MSENLSSTEKLFQKYLSKPYNPRLASIFIKSGMIEAWGRVFEKYEKLVKSMVDRCRNMRLMKTE